MRTLIIKIILIGDGGVGKTSIFKKYMGEGFESTYEQTIGADFSTKEHITNTYKVLLQIWDIAGQDRFETVRSLFYHGAHGIIFVFDVTRPESFNNFNKWLIEIKTNILQPRPLIVIANKIDKDPNHNYNSHLEYDWINKQIQAPIIFTSALNGDNIDLAFNLITENLLTLNQKTLM